METKVKKLKVQKRLSGQLLKCSKYRIKFDSDRLGDIKESITKYDLKKLISQGAITRSPEKSTSKVRVRKLKAQKRKGRRAGQGSRKGKKTARQPKKEVWMNKIRLQREFLKLLKEKKHITSKIYQNLYRKAKGGFFRSKRHMKIYIQDRGLVKK